VLERAAQLIAATAGLLADWPQNFRNLLMDFHGRSPATNRLGHAFGRLYRVLYVDLVDDCFQFLREEFEAHINEHWSGLLARRNRRLGSETVANHPVKYLSQTMGTLGTCRTLSRRSSFTRQPSSLLESQSSRTACCIPGR
jgi:hypothetical protein